MPASVPLLSTPDRVEKSASVFNFDKKATIYQAGEPLFAKGDSAFYFYKLVHGAVICFKSLANGRRSIDSFRFAGDVFGFDCDGERESSAVAVSNVSVRVADCHAVFFLESGWRSGCRSRAVGGNKSRNSACSATVYAPCHEGLRTSRVISVGDVGTARSAGYP